MRVDIHVMSFTWPDQPASMAGYARLGVDAVAVMPVGDPVEFTTSLARQVIPRMGDLGGA